MSRSKKTDTYARLDSPPKNRFKHWASYKRHKNFYDMLSGILLFTAFTGIWWLVFQIADKSLVGGYWTNVITTVGGTVLTIFVLDKWNGNRALEQRKEELILQMGSPDNGFAVEAVRLLRQKGWLVKENLEGANLNGANLQGADLSGANLQGTFLKRANLKGANFYRVDLQRAWLSSANLEFAFLVGTNLKGTFLDGANLHRADLAAANLEFAVFLNSNLSGATIAEVKLKFTSFSGSNLEGADLGSCEFTSDTILPDGSCWTPERDLGEFTDPNHPNFWRSDDKRSPAYRGSAT